MIRISTIVFFVLGLAIGAAAALYFYCPTLCKRGIKTGVAGFLSKLGVSPSLAGDIADELPI